MVGSYIQAGDIIRYPLGLSELIVRRVHEDIDGNLYVKEGLDTEHEYKRFIYKSMTGYKWNTQLSNELGFRLANSDELKYLKE